MKKFHTGDRVRVIHSRDRLEGVVTGRDKHDNVVVEMSDGFDQSFPDKELALVHSSAENAAFTHPPSAVTRAQAGASKEAEARGASGTSGVYSTPAAPARKGIFLGLTAPVAGSNARELVLLNNSDLALALVVGYNREGRYQTDKIVVAPPKQATVLLEVSQKHLQDRPTFQVWAHAATPGQAAHPAPLHTAWHLPTDFAQRPLEPAPVTGRPMLFTELEAPGSAQPTPLAEQKVLGALPGGRLVQAGNKRDAGGQMPDAGKAGLPTPKASTGPSAQAIADAMMAPKSSAPTQSQPSKHPASGISHPASQELDLHIEQLSPRAAQLSSDEILQIQLRAFEEAFEQAQATGTQYLTLIHGVSNPALRQAIHRRLSGAAQNGLIAHFEDYQKDRYGYNATRVKLY